MLTPRQHASINESIEKLRESEPLSEATCYAYASHLEHALSGLHEAGHPGLLVHNLTALHLSKLNNFCLTRSEAKGLTEKGVLVGTEHFTRIWLTLTRVLRRIGRGHVVPPMKWPEPVSATPIDLPPARPPIRLEELVVGLADDDWDAMRSWFDRPRHGSRVHLALLHAVRNLELPLQLATHLRPDFDLAIGPRHVRVIVSVGRHAIDNVVATPQAVSSARIIQRIASDLAISRLGWPTTKTGVNLSEIACRRKLRDAIYYFLETHRPGALNAR